MTPTRFIILGCLFAGGIASAEVPRKDSMATSWLMEHRLFTNPAKEPTAPPPTDLLADWQLTGISELKDGYLVTLANRKVAGEQVVIRPSGARILGSTKTGPDFKVARVQFAKEWRDSVVHLDCGGTAATIGFDEKLPAPASAAPAPPKAAEPDGRPHPPIPANPHQPHAPAR